MTDLRDKTIRVVREARQSGHHSEAIADAIMELIVPEFNRRLDPIAAQKVPLQARIDELEAERLDLIAGIQLGANLHTEAQARMDKLERGLKDALGMLDDPTGGEYVRDMRGASLIIRKALETKHD